MNNDVGRSTNTEELQEFTDKVISLFVCLHSKTTMAPFMTLSDPWPHKCDARISHAPVTRWGPNA